VDTDHDVGRARDAAVLAWNWRCHGRTMSTRSATVGPLPPSCRWAARCPANRVIPTQEGSRPLSALAP
jgi:hypothetical protein